MQIEIHGETERVIQEHLQSGRFATAEAVIDAAVRHFTAPRDRNYASKREELEARMREQGIKPLTDGTELYGDFWPEDESVDDFLAHIYELRATPSRRLREIEESFE